MSAKTPVQFKTQHRSKFFEIDPYGHMNTNHYITHFLEHRFTGMREFIGYDLAALNRLEVAFFTRRLDVEFVRPIAGDESFHIISSTASVGESDAVVVGEAVKENGKVATKYHLEMVCVDKTTGRPMPWPTHVIDKFYTDGAP